MEIVIQSLPNVGLSLAFQQRAPVIAWLVAIRNPYSKPLTLAQLRAVLAVAETGGFSPAASSWMFRTRLPQSDLPSLGL
jgi:hypothetical protein